MSGSLTAEQLARVATLEVLREGNRRLSPSEQVEYGALKDLARSITGPAEVADDPSTLFTDEARRPMLAGGDYLQRELQRSADERERAFKRVFHAALMMLEPVALAALKGALDKGIAQIDVPPALRPVLGVVEAAALDAAGAVVKDVTG